MNVIALSGKSACGKTPTMRLLYENLKVKDYEPKEYVDLENGDFLAVLESRNSKIGIVSQGDWPMGRYSVQAYLEKLDKAGCEAAICTCRTRGGTKEAVLAYTNHKILKKTIVEGNKADERVANEKDVEIIVQIIKDRSSPTQSTS